MGVKWLAIFFTLYTFSQSWPHQSYAKCIQVITILKMWRANHGELPVPCVFSAEFYLAHSILLLLVYGHESHAVYRIWRSPTRRNKWRLADHDQYGCWGHLLRHVPGSCCQLGTVLGCITPPVSREGIITPPLTLNQFLCFRLLLIHMDTERLNSLCLIHAKSDTLPNAEGIFVLSNGFCGLALTLFRDFHSIKQHGGKLKLLCSVS